MLKLFTKEPTGPLVLYAWNDICEWWGLYPHHKRAWRKYPTAFTTYKQGQRPLCGRSLTLLPESEIVRLQKEALKRRIYTPNHKVFITVPNVLLTANEHQLQIFLEDLSYCWGSLIETGKYSNGSHNLEEHLTFIINNWEKLLNQSGRFNIREIFDVMQPLVFDGMDYDKAFQSAYLALTL